jgi:hypothetical protein
VGIKQRLGELEARMETETRRGETPPDVRVLLKAVERHQAREKGKEPPPYTQEEIEEMRRYDLEIAAGGGVVGQLRESVGWAVRRRPGETQRVGRRGPQEVRTSREPPARAMERGVGSRRLTKGANGLKRKAAQKEEI